MGDNTDVTRRKHSFTRISLNINDIHPYMKLLFQWIFYMENIKRFISY